MSVIDILYRLCSLFLGGVILGILIGILATFFIKKMFNDELLVINITFICGFICYFIAEVFLER